MAMVSLKAQNLPLLATLVIAQLAVAYGFSHPDFNWAGLELFTADSVAMAVITLLAALFSSLLPVAIKHQLVYLRLKNVLPGHRFMQLAANDQRIDLVLLQQKVVPLMPMQATEELQNRIWYRHIYQPLQNAPLVKDAHKVFLLWRDGMVVSLSCALLMLIGIYCVPSVAQMFNLYSLMVPFCFALTCGAAANNCGKRFVTNAVVTWLVEP